MHITPLIVLSAPVMAPDNTKENVLLEIPVPANPPKGASIFLDCIFRYTPDANVKSLRVRYSGIIGTLLAFRHATSSTLTEFQIDITIADTLRQWSKVKDITDGALTKHEDAVLSIVDTSQPTRIVLTGQKAVVRDQIELIRCEASLSHSTGD